MPTIDPGVLYDWTRRLFGAAACPPDEAERVARSLVDANLKGHDSHGVIRVVQYLEGLAKGQLRAGVELTILSETPALITADGNWGLGQVQAHRLLKRLSHLALNVGVAVGTLKNCGHIGRLGEYAEWSAACGLAFLGTVNNHGFGVAVAPPGGTEGRIATNPLCLGAPTAESADGSPVVLDIGTSVCAEGKVRVLFNKGEAVPDGWLLDEHGRPTTDPGVLYREPRGTILPLGGPQGYKGFGLGLLLDMLVGGLSGAPCSYPEAPRLGANAVLFVVFDPRHFAGVDHFVREVGGLARNVRNCPRAAGVGAITIPGDPERQAAETRHRGGITLDEGTWAQLSRLAAGYGVPMPRGGEVSTG